MGSLWVYEGDIGSLWNQLPGTFVGRMKAHFQKTFVFQWILMILCSTTTGLGSLGVTLGSLWGHFGVTLGLLWVSEGGFGTLLGYFDVTLGCFWALEGAW